MIGTGASSIQFVPEIQPEVSRAAPLPAHGAVDRPPPRPPAQPRRAGPLPRLPAGPARDAPPDLDGPRAVRDPDDQREALAGSSRAIGLAHLKRQVPDPELREKLTPRYAPGCKRILISNDYLPALAEPNVDVVTDGIAEVREHSVVDRRRPGGRGRHDHLRHRLLRHRAADRPEGPRRRRPHAGRPLGGAGHAGPPRHHRHRLPEPVLPARAQHRPRPQLRDDHGRGPGRLRRCRRSAELDRGVASIEPRIEAQDRWNREVQEATEGTVWVDGGCASWYLDKHGRNTTVWPSFTTGFRRALSHLDPAEYHLAPVARPRGRARRASPEPTEWRPARSAS